MKKGKSKRDQKWIGPVILIIIFLCIVVVFVFIQREIAGTGLDKVPVSKFKSLKSQINYTVPGNWTERENQEGHIMIVSSDHVRYRLRRSVDDVVGVAITIAKSKEENPSRYLDEIIDPPSGMYATTLPDSIEELEIGDRRAVKSLVNDHGHTLNYHVEAPKSFWLVAIYYQDTNDYLEHKASIDKFISSITFND